MRIKKSAEFYADLKSVEILSLKEYKSTPRKSCLPKTFAT